MERSKIINFNAGPSALPENVLEEATKGLLNYNGTGMGLTEISHRSKEFKQLTDDLSNTIRKLLAVPDTHEILFAQGGASLVFSSVVLNLLSRYKLLHPEVPNDEIFIDYVITGVWSKRASEEAKRIGGGAVVNIAADGRQHSADGKSFQSVPPHDAYKFSPASKTAFVYYCENETVHGVQFSDDSKSPTSFPLEQFQGQLDPPVIADFSSSFLSRPIPNIGSYGIVYAGAQKNVGPAGLTILIVRKDLLVDVDAAQKMGAPPVPLTLAFKTLADNGSLYNTPPMFPMYVSLLVVRNLEKNGGLDAMKTINCNKQEAVYGSLKKLEEGGLIKLNVRDGSRSWMNVTLVFTDPAKEQEFVQKCDEKGFRGIKGHRSVGGIRISLYNAITEAQAKQIADFMLEFIKN